ncbi:hypothetical protein [Rubripirellula reticaptiva]|uniref:DUF883 domain-containing protein n=1 Tax=Rubripirellula reticaptiva TaxID=2528013 RepID=A0A5C6F933_9BACT|nr:hypothetical protein [Rubripirellula reticaptiva]TWU58253.1 hypothetical protein Poly59_11640 [Rubripirellula reticaptiva]
MSETTRSTEHVKGVAREFVNDATDSLAVGAREFKDHYMAEPAKDLLSLAKAYAKDKPEVAAVWAFGLGLIVGWKIKPW